MPLAIDMSDQHLYKLTSQSQIQLCYLRVRCWSFQQDLQGEKEKEDENPIQALSFLFICQYVRAIFGIFKSQFLSLYFLLP